MGLITTLNFYFGIAEAKNESPEGMKKKQELENEFTPEAHQITEDMVKRFRCELMNYDSFDIRQHRKWSDWVKQKK